MKSKFICSQSVFVIFVNDLWWPENPQQKIFIIILYIYKLNKSQNAFYESKCSGVIRHVLVYILFKPTVFVDVSAIPKIDLF